MERPWRPALVVGGGVAALLLLRQVVVTIRKKTKKARTSLDPNNNEDEVEHEQIAAESHAEISKQKDPTAHSDTEKEMSVGSSTAVIRRRSMTVEELNEGVGSLDEVSIAIEELSETAREEKLTELTEEMRDRLVREGWRVFRREWVHLGKRIGRGCQADVYAATVDIPFYGSSGSLRTDAVVKKFKLGRGVSKGHNPLGLTSVRCNHVCQLLGVCYDKKHLCLIMPRYESDLRTVIDREMGLHQAPLFPEPVAMHIIMQLALGLRGLHEVGIYHRDLKADNVLVEKRMVVGLASYAIYISDFESSKDVIGTKFHRAPEVLRCVQDCVPVCLSDQEWAAADVYSFGMVCYEILTGNIPMIGENYSDYSKALCGERPELPPDVVPEGLRIIIRRCWDQDPRRRPKPDEIMSLLKKIDNHGVASQCLREVERFGSLEVTSGNPEEDLLELKDILSTYTDPYPEYIISAMEFLYHEEEFISKFHAFSHLPQQSFPLEKYMELRKLHALINWRMRCFLSEMVKFPETYSSQPKVVRMWALISNVYLANIKTTLQQGPTAQERLAQERLPIKKRIRIFLDFVFGLWKNGVPLHFVLDESYVLIDQLGGMGELWTLQAVLMMLRLLLEDEIRLFIGKLFVFWILPRLLIFRILPLLLSFGFSSQILGRILPCFLGKDYRLLWYLNRLLSYLILSPAIGFRLFVQRYILWRGAGLLILARGAGHWGHWFLRVFLYFSRALYLYFLGNGEYFKYCLSIQILLFISRYYLENDFDDEFMDSSRF